MAITNLDICLININLMDNTKMEVQTDFFHTHQNQLLKAIIMIKANFEPGCKVRKEQKILRLIQCEQKINKLKMKLEHGMPLHINHVYKHTKIYPMNYQTNIVHMVHRE
jgi:hypothetical protein